VTSTTPAPTPRGAHPGHAVLQIPVLALEPWVRTRNTFYDPAYVSDDPWFTHAHVTALGPFPPASTATLSPANADSIAQAASAVPPFSATFDQVATFSTGIIHLQPDTQATQAFAAITATLMAAFPDVLPYEGRFTPLPHLTLDLEHTAADGEVTEASTRASVQHLLPAREHVTHLDLAWYAPQECRLLARWELGNGRRVR
jgi:hypothetical protein